MKEITLQTYRERLLRVVVHIQDHLDEELSLDELAEISYFSPQIYLSDPRRVPPERLRTILRFPVKEEDVGRQNAGCSRRWHRTPPPTKLSHY